MGYIFLMGDSAGGGGKVLKNASVVGVVTFYTWATSCFARQSQSSEGIKVIALVQGKLSTQQAGH